MKDTLTAEEKADIRAAQKAEQKYDPKFYVYMTGPNSAIVAEQQIHIMEDGSEMKRCRWMELERQPIYWRWWNGREWKQLFGKYGNRGNAMDGDLPGKRVRNQEDLPQEGKTAL